MQPTVSLPVSAEASLLLLPTNVPSKKAKAPAESVRRGFRISAATDSEGPLSAPVSLVAGILLSESNLFSDLIAEPVPLDQLNRKIDFTNSSCRP